jgi:hypothetical protein
VLDGPNAGKNFCIEKGESPQIDPVTRGRNHVICWKCSGLTVAPLQLQLNRSRVDSVDSGKTNSTVCAKDLG